MPKFKDSALGRGFKLGKLGLSLTGSYLGYQLQNLLRSPRPATRAVAASGKGPRARSGSSWNRSKARS